MEIGILAPVPAIFLSSAVSICGRFKKVVFGTNAWEQFNDPRLAFNPGVPVLIYASMTGISAPLALTSEVRKYIRAGYATLRGRIIGFRKCDSGFYPNPEYRPSLTIDGPVPDTKWAAFWEVEQLEFLGTQLISLRSDLTKKKLAKNFIPHGPTLVEIP